jgi:hypothetical protein
MRHLFHCRQLGSVLLLTHFVIQPAGLGLLIQRARYALLFRARPRSTCRTVAVATIAGSADHDLSMTTLAGEDPAIWFRHP